MSREKKAKKPKLPELDDDGFMVDLHDLKRKYRETYWDLRRALKKAESVREDKDGMPAEHADLKLLKEAISDVNMTIMWIHTGRQPGGSKRGIERRSAYQRHRYKDPLIMQAYSNQYNSRSSSTLTSDQMFQLEEALRRLSKRERECYELQHGQGFSSSYIANMIGIGKESVKEYVERAQRKVSEDLRNNLFLMDYWDNLYRTTDSE